MRSSLQEKRKTAVYDELDHPELDLASLNKAYDKLDGKNIRPFPELEYFGQMHGTYLFAQEMGAFISLTSTRLKSGSNKKNTGRASGTWTAVSNNC